MVTTGLGQSIHIEDHGAIMAEAKEVEVQVLTDEQDDTENKVSAPKKLIPFRKRYLK